MATVGVKGIRMAIIDPTTGLVIAAKKDLPKMVFLMPAVKSQKVLPKQILQD